VSASSFASSSAWGSVCGGGFVTSGMGQIEMSDDVPRLEQGNRPRLPAEPAQ
jgi:hypothetical protein